MRGEERHAIRPHAASTDLGDELLDQRRIALERRRMQREDGPRAGRGVDARGLDHATLEQPSLEGAIRVMHERVTAAVDRYASLGAVAHDGDERRDVARLGRARSM